MIHWDTLSPENRNLLVLEHLPQPPHEPMRRWSVECDGKQQSLMARDERHAHELLHLLNQQTPEELADLGRSPFWAGWMELREETWAIRYSDTPGGAWLVLEEVRALGYLVRVRWGKHVVVSAEKGTQLVSVAADTRFSEVACVLWLRLNGVEITWGAEVPLALAL